MNSLPRGRLLLGVVALLLVGGYVQPRGLCGTAEALARRRGDAREPRQSSLHPKGLSFYRGSSSTSHSMRYFYTGVSQPSQGLPRFIVVVYIDDQPITHYDSNTQEKVPVAPWMKKVEKDNPRDWSAESQALLRNEDLFKKSLVALQNSYNQTSGTGLHTLQLTYGCEGGTEEQLGLRYWKFGYDGEDFLDFDKETLSWTAADRQAEISKQKLDSLLNYSKQCMSYLDEKCIDWLQKRLEYGKEALQRTERPTVKVARKEGYGGQETLICQTHGFYPKEIEIAWTKDGEVKWQDTLTGGVVPNSDGTYHTWLSIEVDPKDRGRYRCQVGHDSLREPLHLAWEEPASNVGLIVGVLLGVLAALILLGAGVAYYLKKNRCPESSYERATGD
ncbi:major histocompatibility complex class I-related gene protein-like [Eublepharis macularius]|uniref:Major histocompatibility complex class I-related gene protein-like n=1 Tax=Eublepharis macularius TaxID=481883 RepID=A0AA97J7Z6_EUBMA|nr:major histocompatibility complex class I-related gene protein-like [Eublepharis macularius]